MIISKKASGSASTGLSTPSLCSATPPHTPTKDLFLNSSGKTLSEASSDSAVILEDLEEDTIHSFDVDNKIDTSATPAQHKLTPYVGPTKFTHVYNMSSNKSKVTNT